MENITAKKALHLEHLIGQKLRELGIPANLKGYRYLKTGIYEAMLNPNILKGITKTFYPYLAEAHDTTPSRVERAIRHSIEVSFTRVDANTLREHFGSGSSTTRPTNSEFIHTILEEVQEEVRRGELGE